MPARRVPSWSSSRSRPTNDVASIGRPRTPSTDAELAQLVGEGRRQLGQLVAPGLDPVLVAVLGEELPAVQRERRPIRGRSPRSAGVDRRPLELVDVHDDVR